MAFNLITIGSKTFNSIGNGVYNLSTVLFGQAQNLFKINRGTKDKNGRVNASISRHVEKDVVATGTRDKLSIVLQITSPPSFTVEEIDEGIADISTWATPENLTRVLMGEN